MAVPFQIIVGTDRVIRGDFSPASSISRGILIIAHGFKGFKDWGMFPYAAEYLAQDVDVLTFNFSHNGVGDSADTFTELEKFARNTYSHELEDLSTLLSVIRLDPEFKTRLLQADDEEPVVFYPSHIRGVLADEKSAVLQQPVFLLGHSRGGGVSLIYALEHPGEIASVISWNGITNVDIFGSELKEEMRSAGRGYVINGRTKDRMPLDVEILDDIEANRERFDIEKRIREASFPVLLVQGEHDYEAFRKGSQRLIAANPSIEYVQIAEGDHTFGAVHPFQGATQPLQEALETTSAFLKRRVMPT